MCRLIDSTTYFFSLIKLVKRTLIIVLGQLQAQDDQSFNYNDFAVDIFQIENQSSIIILKLSCQKTIRTVIVDKYSV